MGREEKGRVYFSGVTSPGLQDLLESAIEETELVSASTKEGCINGTAQRGVYFKHRQPLWNV